MRTTVTLDDSLMEAARQSTGIKQTSALIEAALRSLVQKEASRRLAKLGGSMPHLKVPARKRAWAD